MQIVNATGLRKTYGDFTAVNGIDFSINEGEIFAEELQTRFEGCNVITNQDHSLSLFSENRLSLLPVMQYFSEKGIAVYEAKELRPSLEDVFVKVTGIEALRLKKEKGSEAQ